MPERNPPIRTPRAAVYAVIDGERDYQQNLPSNRSEDPTRIRVVSEYLTMLDHYVRHAQDAWTTRAGIEVPLHDMRKIAALAVRCMEEWGALPRELRYSTDSEEDSSTPRIPGCGGYILHIANDFDEPMEIVPDQK